MAVWYRDVCGVRPPQRESVSRAGTKAPGMAVARLGVTSVLARLADSRESFRRKDPREPPEPCRRCSGAALDKLSEIGHDFIRCASKRRYTCRSNTPDWRTLPRLRHETRAEPTNDEPVARCVTPLDCRHRDVKRGSRRACHVCAVRASGRATATALWHWQIH